MTTVAEWFRSVPVDKCDARVFLRTVIGFDRVQLITHGNRPLSDNEIQQLSWLVENRLKGIPVPYLVGEQEFFSRPFKVTPDVLIPRPDTETLIEWVLTYIPKQCTIADLGCGSGCIAITLALEEPSFTLYASDISEKALNIAKENAQRLKAPVTFLQGSWLKPFAEIPLDVIVSNPPYIKSGDPHLKNLSFEPRGALTDEGDGLSCIREILLEAQNRKTALKAIAIEHGWDQGELVRELFEEHQFSGAKTMKDYGGNDRFTVWSSVAT